MIRKQHPGFGTELRALLRSEKTEDKHTAGIVVDEIVALDEARRNGTKHPDETQLNGTLSEVHYLKLYKSGESIRIYFCVIASTLFMLCLFASKRRTKLTDGMKDRLATRLRDVKASIQRTRS